VLLEMGAYQVLEMHSVPAYAAVSQTVAQVRNHGFPGLAGVANAVLRRIADEGAGPEWFPALDENPLGYLTTWGSHPSWLVRRWLARWPVETVAGIVAANNSIPQVCVRPLVGSAADALKRLEARGIEGELVSVGSSPAGAECVALETGRDVRAALTCISGFAQDPAAAEVARFAAQDGGAWALDLCAAPGGKALALSRVFGLVMACDRSEARARMVRDGARRLGARGAAVVADAKRPAAHNAPLVLVDAPCTGTGTLRRHPDGRWRVREHQIQELAAAQDRILDGAQTAVAPGGLLVYATCSLEREENEERVARFLARHRGFSLEMSDVLIAGADPPGGILSLLPTDTGYDGAFAARLRRIR